ncbi:hypothetical protein [Stenotrophomonas rhizophila]|uniref:Uncharacterized protein n=1 Tax=Stenotrophomonas rhizophila TaxID=216778 RepID=A0A7V7YDQ7_9GAMM|nr:hypothetical protein [Stenotrophomonas rhizophila]KAB7628919.1 hypothetical protein F9K92_15860 [Stenotrophomonas rhizophila]
MNSNKFEDLMPEPDDFYRTQKYNSEKPEDQQWAEADKLALSIDQRLLKYDTEIHKRESGSKLFDLNRDYENALKEKEEFSKSKPFVFGVKGWKEGFLNHERAVSNCYDKLEEWEAKCTPEEIQNISSLREIKYEQLQDALNKRRELGMLPSEEADINKSLQNNADKAEQNDTPFSVLGRIKDNDPDAFAKGKREDGTSMGNNEWASKTLMGLDPELQELARVQKQLTMELGRPPRENEVIAYENNQKAADNNANGEHESEFDKNTERRTRRQ